MIPNEPYDFKDLTHRQLESSIDQPTASGIVETGSPVLGAFGLVEVADARSKTFKLPSLVFNPGGAPKFLSPTITAISVRHSDARTSARMTVAFNIHSDGQTTWKWYWNSEVTCDAMLLDGGGGVLEHRQFKFQIHCSDRGTPKIEVYDIRPDVFESARGARIYSAGRFKGC